ncbi:hypothetical protein ACFSWD_21850 [Paenibacillus xanthanilyticus]
MDHQEMATFFEWTFPVISMEASAMEEIYNVSYLPYAMLVDASGKVLNKGAVYNKEDFDFLMHKSLAAVGGSA